MTIFDAIPSKEWGKSVVLTVSLSKMALVWSPETVYGQNRQNRHSEPEDISPLGFFASSPSPTALEEDLDESLQMDAESPG